MVSSPAKDEPRIKLRLLICLCSTIVHFTNSANRVVLTISLVAMVGHTPESHATKLIDNSTTLSANGTTNEKSFHHKKKLKQLDITEIVEPKSNYTGLYDVKLTESINDQLFGIVFLGGLITPIPTGRLAEKYGPKVMVTMLLFANAFAMSLFPLAASWSLYAAAFLLFIKGAGTSPLFSCSSVLCSHWCPKYEKTMYISIVSTGSMLAIILINPFTGYLCSLNYLNGWPLGFYFMGIVNILTIIVWLSMVTNDPIDHPLITSIEKDYILKERTAIDDFNNKAVPFGKIFTCGPIYALFLAHFAYYWYTALIAHQIPDYLKTILNVSMTEDGFLSGLPYIGSTVSLAVFSYIIDKLRAGGRFSTTAIRKISVDIGFIFSPAFLILSTCFSKSLIAVTACVCLSTIMASALVAGLFSIHLDIAPSYTGSLAGMIETIHNGSAMVMNHATFYLIGDQPTLHNWTNLFLVTSVICVFGTHYFALLGSSKLQSWDPTFKSDEKALEEDQNGEMAYPTIFDPEIYVVDSRSGSIVRKQSLAAASLELSIIN